MALSGGQTSAKAQQTLRFNQAAPDFTDISSLNMMDLFHLAAQIIHPRNVHKNSELGIAVQNVGSF